MRTRLVLCLLAWLMPMAVLADEATEAKKFYELGRLNYDLGRYAEALEAFEKAYAQKPLPGFHFNIGQCQRKLEDYEGAITSFEKYLELTPKASNRKMVEELIAEAGQRQAEAAALAAAQPAPAEEPTPAEETTSELSAASATPTTTQPDVAPEPEAEPSIFETWWFWTAVGGGALVVAAGATTAVLVALNQETPEEEPSLGRVDLRGGWSW